MSCVGKPSCTHELIIATLVNALYSVPDQNLLSVHSTYLIVLWEETKLVGEEGAN